MAEKKFRTKSIVDAADNLCRHLRIPASTPRGKIEKAVMIVMSFGYDDALHSIAKEKD